MYFRPDCRLLFSEGEAFERTMKPGRVARVCFATESVLTPGI